MDEIKTDEIVMQPVDSSNIAAIGFSEKTGTIRVAFIGGGTYEATGATKEHFDAFVSAKSKGVHFNRNLKSAFEFTKIQKKG